MLSVNKVFPNMSDNKANSKNLLEAHQIFMPSTSIDIDGIDSSSESRSRSNSAGTASTATVDLKKSVNFDSSTEACGVQYADVELLWSRFPKPAKMVAETPECFEFLDEIMAQISQPNHCAGLAGLQQWLTNNCGWGMYGTSRFCELKGHLQKLKCTAASCFAEKIMSESPEVKNGEVVIGRVQLIQKIGEDAQLDMIESYFKKKGYTSKYFIVGNLCFHECILKIVASERRATAWDFSLSYDAPASAKAAFAVVAFRFFADVKYDTVRFGNYQVPLGEWFTTCPEMNMRGLTNVVMPELSQRTSQKICDSYGLRHGAALTKSTLMTVFISGTCMNNGNPCPGVGTARCLRRAFGDSVKLVAFDYSLEAGGCKDPMFDEVNVVKELFGKKNFVRETLVNRVKRCLTETPNSFFISTFDVEIDMLSDCMAKIEEAWTERVLIPTAEVLKETEKPDVRIIQKHFGMNPPDNIMVEEDNEDEIKKFIQAHGVPCLAKGVHFGCARIGNAAQAMGMRASYRKKWGSECFVSEAINGYEGSYMFASYKGKLLGAIQMRKDLVTKEGKCWGVHTESLSKEALASLNEMCKASKWTGGGEIEFMEDCAGIRYITDFNPRFPAWVFGGCHGGINLPGLLLQEATGYTSQDKTSSVIGGDFIRTCLEIPVNNKLIQPLFVAGPERAGMPVQGVGCKGSSISFHPSRFGEIAQLNMEDLEEEESDCEVEEFNEDEIEDEKIWVLNPEPFKNTPQFILNTKVLRETITDINDFVTKVGEANGVKTIVGLSVKTQPHSTVLNTAREAGWFAECISQAEVQKSLDCGFPPSEVIVNGPLKNWPLDLPNNEPLKAWFADSLEDFDALIDVVPAEYIGFRLTPSGINSRFGVPIELWKEMKQSLASVKEDQKIGIHFHFAQSKLGSTGWFGMARGVIRMIALMCPQVQLLDFGGGWAPGALIRHEKEMNALFKYALKRLPHVETVVFEPGKSVSQSSGALVTSVKMFRGACGQQRDLKEKGKFHGRGVIVDTMIGSLGVGFLHKHDLFYHSEIKIENEAIEVHECTGSPDELVFIAENLKESQPWAKDFTVNELLDVIQLKNGVCHYSNWLVATENEMIVGVVMIFEPESFEKLSNETNFAVVEFLSKIVFSDRSGLHLLNLMATESAISSLIKHASASAYDLGENNVYVVSFDSSNTEALESCSFTVPSEQDEDSDYTILRRKYWKPLNPGKDKILGRICMEFDQFGDITIPEDLKVGDLIMMRECGAYDMTMSYLFGDAIERDIVTL